MGMDFTRTGYEHSFLNFPFLTFDMKNQSRQSLRECEPYLILLLFYKANIYGIKKGDRYKRKSLEIKQSDLEVLLSIVCRWIP